MLILEVLTMSNIPIEEEHISLLYLDLCNWILIFTVTSDFLTGILIIARHMLWFLWITVLTTNDGIPQGFVLGDGVCANYHDETVYAEMKEIVISHPQFCSNPICCCCFFPCETQKNYFKRVFTQLFYTCTTFNCDFTVLLVLVGAWQAWSL